MKWTWWIIWEIFKNIRWHIFVMYICLQSDLKNCISWETFCVCKKLCWPGSLLWQITSTSNYKPIQLESSTGLLSLKYETLPGSKGNGFNATFHVGSYCPPWEGRCGGTSGGCFTQEQRCDGKWDCPETGKDEEGCRGCGPNQFACGAVGPRMLATGHFAGRPLCYPVKERCNYQLYCTDGSDERDCSTCQPGTFHCDSDRSVILSHFNFRSHDTSCVMGWEILNHSWTFS